MGTPSGARVLIVDDEKLIRWSLTQALEQAGYSVEQAATCGQALDVCERLTPDLVLLDYTLPDGLGTEILPALNRLAPRAPVLMISAHASVPGAAEGQIEGVSAIISKPFELSDVLGSVARELDASRLRQAALWQQEQALRASGGSLVANSRAMLEVSAWLMGVAPGALPVVLLRGEAGTGKAHIARLLHAQGKAARGAFLRLPCSPAATPTLEAQVFGQEKDTLHAACPARKGLLEIANHGTLFLDEIARTSVEFQTKLCGFLEEQSWRRGGAQHDRHSDVQVIVATSADLEQEARGGRFAERLLERLNACSIQIPPLRERREDVLDLARAFLLHFNSEFGKSIVRIEATAESALLEHAWPANVRELRNTIERAVLLGGGNALRRCDLMLPR